MIINITPEQKRTLRSMSHYWDEVSKRDGASCLLINELTTAYEILGAENSLAIISEYVNKS